MKQPVIIIGMYGSGISLVSKMLHHSGIFMGADQNENAGSQFFRNLNKWMFVQAGATWDNPYNFRFINENFTHSLQKALKRHLKGKPLRKFLGSSKKGNNNYEAFTFDWGWNDELNTYTIQVWESLFDNPKIVHVYRNPVDVAANLRSRAIAFHKERQKRFLTGFKQRKLENHLSPLRIYEYSLRVLNPEEGFRLWQQYLKQALSIAEKTGAEVYQIRFEDLLDDSENRIKELFRFLEFKLPDGMIGELAAMTNKNDRFAFVKDKILREFYETIRNHSLVTEMNYHDIC